MHTEKQKRGRGGAKSRGVWGANNGVGGGCLLSAASLLLLLPVVPLPQERWNECWPSLAATRSRSRITLTSE